MQPSDCPFQPSEGLPSPKWAILLHFRQNGETNFSVFRIFQPRAAGIKKNKGPAHYHRRRNDSVTSSANEPVDARTGASDGNFQLFAHVGRRRDGLGHGLIWACVRPRRWDAAFPRSRGSGQEIRRAIRGICIPTVRRRTVGDLASVSSASSTTSGSNWRYATGIGNAAYRRRRFGFSPSWTMRKPARDAPASARSTAPSISQSTQ